MIIALEGIDASGKQTQVRLLKERLAPHFVEVETFDFPHYQGGAGGLIGRILKGETVITDEEGLGAVASDYDYELDRVKQSWSIDKALVIQCAMLVDRLEHLRLLRRFVDDDTRLLILDRYYLSGLVYGQADGLSLEWLERVHEVLPTADVFFLLDIPVEESVRRRLDRRDYYEKNLTKLKKVRDLYLEMAASRDEVVRIDGTNDPETVALQITNFVLSLR